MWNNTKKLFSDLSKKKNKTDQEKNNVSKKPIIHTALLKKGDSHIGFNLFTFIYKYI